MTRRSLAVAALVVLGIAHWCTDLRDAPARGAGPTNTLPAQEPAA